MITIDILNNGAVIDMYNGNNKRMTRWCSWEQALAPEPDSKANAEDKGAPATGCRDDYKPRRVREAKNK